MRKFWPLGDVVRICNVFCALAPNPMTATSFVYVENIVQTNLHRFSSIRGIKNGDNCRKLCLKIKKIKIFQWFHFICTLAPGVLFNFIYFTLI
jgi:hypothetical protein